MGLNSCHYRFIALNHTEIDGILWLGTCFIGAGQVKGGRVRGRSDPPPASGPTADRTQAAGQ